MNDTRLMYGLTSRVVLGSSAAKAPGNLSPGKVPR